MSVPTCLLLGNTGQVLPAAEGDPLQRKTDSFEKPFCTKGLGNISGSVSLPW